jgi:hypothetical protein
MLQNQRTQRPSKKILSRQNLYKKEEEGNLIFLLNHITLYIKQDRRSKN